MLAALVVHRMVDERDRNLNTLTRLAGHAADAEADLVMFSEAALTGLVNTGDPAHDLPLGEPIPGPATETLGRIALARDIWLAVGLFERDGDTLYDSAVLIDPDGAIALRYRRINPGWRWPGDDPRTYGSGTELPAAVTPWGTVAFLLCGDLFDDEVVERVREVAPDLLLVPFARSFEDGSIDRERWEREESPVYAKRVARAGVDTLLTAYLREPMFGGAMAASREGEILDSLPIGREGALLTRWPAAGASTGSGG